MLKEVIKLIYKDRSSHPEKSKPKAFKMIDNSPLSFKPLVYELSKKLQPAFLNDRKNI